MKVLNSCREGMAEKPVSNSNFYMSFFYQRRSQMSDTIVAKPYTLCFIPYTFVDVALIINF